MALVDELRAKRIIITVTTVAIRSDALVVRFFVESLVPYWCRCVRVHDSGYDVGRRVSWPVCVVVAPFNILWHRTNLAAPEADSCADCR